MVVIPFPGSRNPVPSPASGSCKPLGVTVEAALKVHGAIVDGLRSGAFDSHTSGFHIALTDMLSEMFGHSGVSWAEMQFEIVFGVDPYTFTDHMAAYRPGGSRAS
ncbi:MAG: hypothetical protein KIT00_13285 [Rhodospirillales bacterium]|nr:hypothetical protein [Rhodospirillales bacterium]